MVDNFDSHRNRFIKLFSSYSKKNHLKLLELYNELAETFLPEELGNSINNPYFEELMDCSRVILGQTQWLERFFFLNLLENFVEKKINICQFYSQFDKKFTDLEESSNFLEFNLIFLKISPEAAILFSLIGDIFVSMEDEQVSNYCNDFLDEDEIFNSDYFYYVIEEIYLELKELI